MEEITDNLFTNEMKILWQNLDNCKRDELGNLIKNYFEGDRSEKIINKMQCGVE